MRFSNPRFAFLSFLLTLGIFIGVFGGSLPARAVVDVSSSDLQSTLSILFPDGGRLPALQDYSSFFLQSKGPISGGVVGEYGAYLLADPWLKEELPQVQLVLFSYASQEDAQAELSRIASNLDESNRKTLSRDARNLFYQSEGGDNVDGFATVDAEYFSFHWIHVNGNLLYQASLFRTDGEFNEKNLQSYAAAISDLDAIETVLLDLIEGVKIGLGILFPPTRVDFNLNSDSFSYALSKLIGLPSHGSISFDLYISDPEGARGTILDSAGIGKAQDGDLYLYLNKNGTLLAGLYAPDFDANCEQEIGWYQVQTSQALYPYEWNTVELHFGVGGLSVDLNEVEAGSCSFSQARRETDLYLGDFSGDGIAESMIGYVNNIQSHYSVTDTGKPWDEVLTEQLFLDLPNTDPDLRIFEFLKEEGIFLGSNGMLYPDQILNRAEMVKVLLKTFDQPVESGTIPFWDVPSDAWYRKYLATAYAIGMIEGHENGGFLPASSLNRAEFFTMLYRMDSSRKVDYEDEFLDVNEENWFMPGAAYAHSQGLVEGVFFHPDHSLTRREVAYYLYALLL